MPVVMASHGNQVCSGWLNEITSWAKGQAADLTDACKASDLRLRDEGTGRKPDHQPR